MIGKLVVLSALVAVVLAQAQQWPAGLNPAACPNYPNCDNTVVALYGGLPYAAPAAPVGRSYPAGVPAAACPNYPFCGSAAAPAGYVAREYPAGVPAAACPNYPYC